MGQIKQRLKESLALCIGAIILVSLLIIGIYVLSYIIIAVAAVAIVAFIIAQIKHWFSGSKVQSSFSEKKAGPRTIDHEDPPHSD